MTRAITANVWSALERQGAIDCLDFVLAADPDLVGLQEWRLPRAPLLLDSGVVGVAGLGRFRIGGGAHAGPMTWLVSVPGDCVIGLRAERFVVRRSGLSPLGLLGRADPGSRRPAVLPPRWATYVEADDRQDGRRIGVIGYHLLPGAQRRSAYRTDRPRNSSRHHHEVARLQGLVDAVRGRCDVVWAMGDSNFHGLALDGLVSAWADRPGPEGTLGSYRRIDDVFCNAAAPTGVRLLSSVSDHRFVQADYA